MYSGLSGSRNKHDAKRDAARILVTWSTQQVGEVQEGVLGV